jgi:hypothetical protein
MSLAQLGMSIVGIAGARARAIGALEAIGRRLRS